MTEENRKQHKPGEVAEVSGIYKNLQTGFDVTVVKGEHFPPTPESGQRYELVDRANHKSD